ncbi:MAG: HNH nuclease family protein [Desulfuromusa sp.]|nr:HNH nuclease family protein [Desulfuromusa sp.]
MSTSGNKMNDKERDQLVVEMRQEEQQRQSGYREQALKLFPHVCGRCTREFEGKNIRELTVHHIDHNHDNNPTNGSNWELLCIYCHDHEHSRGIQEDRVADSSNDQQKQSSLSHSPFAALAKKFEEKT